jgi:hypothetical protein
MMEPTHSESLDDASLLSPARLDEAHLELDGQLVSSSTYSDPNNEDRAQGLRSSVLSEVLRNRGSGLTKRFWLRDHPEKAESLRTRAEAHVCRKGR